MTEEKFIARNHCLKIDPIKKFKSDMWRHMLSRFGIYEFWDFFPFRWRLYYYDYIKPIFNPSNKRIRKAIPRQYSDITNLIVMVNFEFIKAFYEDEYKADIIDWEATEAHKNFADWLEKAYNYITVERPNLELQRDNAYPDTGNFLDRFVPTTDDDGKKAYEFKDDGIPYEVKYKEVNRLEQEIDDNDKRYLIDMILRKDYFWT